MLKDKIEDGVKFFKMKRWESALNIFLDALTRSEDASAEEKTEIAYYTGLCYVKLERYNDALLHLEQVVTSNSGPLRICQCRLTLAYIYTITKRTKMAEFELERLLKSGFQAVQIYSMLGYAAWTQKNYPSAVEWYEKALEIDSTNPTAMNGLGYVLVDNDIDVRRGLELCKRAVDKKPQSAMYLDSLGWAYYKSGAINEARTWLRRALDLAPRQKEIKLHIKAIISDGGDEQV